MAELQKIREVREVTAGLGGARRETRVRELEAGEAPPAGSEPVPADTETTDWEPE